MRKRRLKVMVDLDEDVYEELASRTLDHKIANTQILVRRILKNFLSVTAFKHKPKAETEDD